MFAYDHYGVLFDIRRTSCIPPSPPPRHFYECSRPQRSCGNIFRVLRTDQVSVGELLDVLWHRHQNVAYDIPDLETGGEEEENLAEPWSPCKPGHVTERFGAAFVECG